MGCILCVPLVPLRGMRSAQWRVEVFDGWTRRQIEAEELHTIAALIAQSPTASRPQVIVAHNVSTMSVLEVLKKLSLTSFAEPKASKGAQPEALPVELPQVPVDADGESKSIAQEVGVSTKLADTNHPSCGSATSEIVRCQKLKCPKSCIELPQKELKRRLPFGRRIRSAIDILKTKVKGHNGQRDVPAAIEPVQNEGAEFEATKKQSFSPYVMDMTLEQIQNYRRKDVVYGVKGISSEQEVVD